MAPSDWVCRFSADLPAGRRVLDLACGRGRHVRWLAAQGHVVTAVDRDAQALAGLEDVAGEIVCADLESGTWPLTGRRFDLVVVTHYLWRPRLPEVLACVAPGGRLVWETFAAGQQRLGRPHNPDFLLQPLELIDHVRGPLHVLAFEDGLLDAPPRRVQRIAACRPCDPPGDPGSTFLLAPRP
ncbi:methyltransferase family protein [Sphaerotilus hippei]|uniref:Methyltransferase family protein n=1 Tax=Sphaerotilus hippei TaxID=744406 RepID=A0A318GYS1_9BURK|nr:class I SAM-dependent methyltransferase [Sphaerotilus hippei]PXW94715.1 methyltransferase family protein [Sphaerotilus hippei]